MREIAVRHLIDDAQEILFLRVLRNDDQFL